MDDVITLLVFWGHKIFNHRQLKVVIKMDSNYCWLKLVFLDFFLCHCCCVIVPASVWPEGYYGLPMADTGCPGGASVNWETGWIFQDTENNSPSSSKSLSFHLEGQVTRSSVNRSFCIKTNGTNDQQRPLWPAGTYCIYQGSSKCPLGFKSGSITWDDEHDQNKNDKNGTLPKVLLGSTTTKIYFCCRNDGRKTTPIDLPTVSPFYLFAHESVSCQQVRWAVSTSEWIHYDTEDDDNQGDDVSQPAPYVHVTVDIGPKIYYCYYTSCQYTLNASTGSIKFPLSTRNYVNGQQCSWRISVKSYQTIQVHFTQVLLSDFNDQLIFYDGTDNSAPRLAILYGRRLGSNAVPDVHSSSSNLFVVFRSNKVASRDGFKASYKAIGTSTAPPLTSSPPSATTVKTTLTTSTKATSAAATPDTAQETDRPTSRGSGATLTTETTEPSETNGNFSKNYDAKSCIQQNQPGYLTTVAIVIPLICIIAVIVMAAYLFFRLRKLRKQPSDVSVRFTSESINNPSYTQSDAVIEARAPSTNHTYEDSKGDVYDEVEYQAQSTDNPLYLSTNTDTHVYASFA